MILRTGPNTERRCLRKKSNPPRAKHWVKPLMRINEKEGPFPLLSKYYLTRGLPWWSSG